jgi:hypothetical protein
VHRRQIFRLQASILLSYRAGAIQPAIERTGEAAGAEKKKTSVRAVVVSSLPDMPLYRLLNARAPVRSTGYAPLQASVYIPVQANRYAPVHLWIRPCAAHGEEVR